VAQVLDAAKNPHGPIIRASFPLPFSMNQVQRSQVCSDVEAWFLTEEGVDGTQYPVSSMRWGSCWTAGAASWGHIHPNGLGTYLDVSCGSVLVLLLEREDAGRHFHFGSVMDFVETDDGPDLSKLHVEPVYLSPGLRL
jgi:hypothetical protein